MSDKHCRSIQPRFVESTHPSQDHPDAGLGCTRSSPDLHQKTCDIVKHRKVPESITRNACLNCKKARAKCTGRTPCKRCASRLESSECVYEIHIKHAKKDLIKQIKDLQTKDAISQQIFQSLAANINATDILDMLRKEEPLESIARRLNQFTIINQGRVSPSVSSAVDDAGLEMRDGDSEALGWTAVTSDRSVLDHLFQLYFTWVHPVHTLFDEWQFVRSYHAGNTHEDSYCSAVLVNALCAMACHLHLHTDSDVLSYAKLGNEFSDAARESIDPEDMHLTTVQALGVMALIEIGRGNGLRAASYLQVALGCLSKSELKHRIDDQEAWTTTLEGIQQLNIEWAQLTFQIPAEMTITLGIDRRRESKNEIFDKARWYFYTSTNDPVISYPSLRATISREKSKLTSIIQDITTTLYSPQVPSITAQHIIQLYNRLLDWRSHLPDPLVRQEEQSHEHSLPYFLSLLILYSNAVILLLQPLLSYEGFPAYLVEDIVWTQAQQGFSILEDQYKRQFNYRCQPVLQMYALLHFATVIARHFPGGTENNSMDGPGAIKTAINILEESRPTFPVAEIMQEMLRRTAVTCSIRVSSRETSVESVVSVARKQYCMDDFIEACTRLTYVQPVDEIHRRFAPSLIDDWLAYHNATASLAPSLSITPTDKEVGAHGLMQIMNLLNTD